MSLEQVLQAIPHRPPFLLVDEILHWEEGKLIASRLLTGEEFWFQGHYPERPIMPGVLQCEAALQAGAILLSRHVTAPLDKQVPVATRLNNVRFKHIIRPGERMEIEVVLTDRLSDAFFLNGKVSVGGKVATRLEFACTVAEVK